VTHRLLHFPLAKMAKISANCRSGVSATTPADVAAVERRDSQTDGQTPDRYMDPSAHTMRAAPITSIDMTPISISSRLSPPIKGLCVMYGRRSHKTHVTRREH